MFDGLKTWRPRKRITYFESRPTAAVPAKIHHPRRLHQSPCSVPGTRRTKATPFPVSIALAWVRHQPFPCLPVVGPRTVDEVDDTLTALGVRLSDNETRWLAADDPEVLR